MQKQLRIAHVIVQPVLVYDNGEELEPGPEAKPVQVPLSALAELAEQFREECAKANKQEDNPPAP